MIYLPDVLARVGERDLVDLVGVEPDLALSALEYGCGKPLLELQRHLFKGHTDRKRGGNLRGSYINTKTPCAKRNAGWQLLTSLV